MATTTPFLGSRMRGEAGRAQAPATARVPSGPRGSADAEGHGFGCRAVPSAPRGSAPELRSGRWGSGVARLGCAARP